MQNSITQSAEILEKQKKLFMKSLLNALRKFFNSKKLAFHLLNTCVSIKPGSEKRCASLQSYPNQGVWKSLKSLDTQLKEEITQFLTLELQAKSKKIPQQILIEFKDRVEKDFDFSSFYREEKHTEEEIFPCIEEEKQDTPNIDHTGENNTKEIVKQKKWSKAMDFVSESRQILIQMQLCNQQKSLAEITPLHYHKLRTLLEKIKEQKYKQSEVMREFEQELRVFCEKEDSNLEELPKKRVKKNETKKQIVRDDSLHLNKEHIQIINNEDIQQEDILTQFQRRIEKIEPGIKMFLPQYSKRLSEDNKKKTLMTEDEYFKHLYYLERAENVELTPKRILCTWRQQFEPYIWKYFQVLKEEEI